jgi:PAS domain S-box-containing protein
MKILVVEDDVLVSEALVAILTHHNYAAEVATDGEAAWNLIQTFDYDLLLLDILLPKLDGISLCRQIRAKGLLVPILLLSGCDRQSEKAVGLNAGADDYLIKPFDQEELIARIHALLRRGQISSQPILEFGELQLDPTNCQVKYCEKILTLTPKEYSFLELFLRNPKRVFSCGMILEHLWSYEETPGEEAVRTHIKGLRHKLKAAGAPSDVIETVYGIGYRLKPQAEHKCKPLTQPSTQQTVLAVARVWQKFKGRIDEEVSIIAQAATKLSENNLNPELRASAYKEAHTLAGSLGTFGLGEGSKLASQIEKLLHSDQFLGDTEAKKLNELVQALQHEVDRQTPQADITTKTHSQYQAEILVVDDDPKILALLETLLVPWGIKVYTVNHPKYFWEILKVTKPDLLILDVEMPEVSGIELCQAIRNDPDWSNLPILFLTVHTDTNIVNQVFTVGADDFVNKPIVGPELVTRIINRLERVRLLQRIQQHPEKDHTSMYWRAIFDAEPECVKLVAADGTLLEMNPAGLTIIEADQAETVVGQNIYSLIAPEYREAFRELNEKVCQGNKGTLEFEIITCRGNRRWMETHAVPLQQPDGTVVQLGITHNISKYKQAEADIRRISRTLKALSMCNQTLVRTQNESDLLQNICRIIVDVGSYRLAWVGYAENNQAKSITPVAQAGYENGYLNSLNLTWDIKEGREPTGIAISLGNTCIVQNILSDSNYLWQREANNRGFAALISLPLIAGNQQFGAISIYASELDAFDADEVKLLEELAADLAYGILALRQKQERENAENALQRTKEHLELRVAERTAELITVNQNLQSELEERLRIQEALRNSQALFAGIVNIADDAIISIDSNQCITLFNSGAEKIFGYENQEVLGKPLDLLLPNRYTQAHRKHVAEFHDSPSQARRMAERREIYGKRKDGSEFPAEASISKLKLGEEIVYTVYLQDISDRKEIERIKDEFISVVSHELRTPLTSMHGSLGMLASGLIKSDSEQGKRLLQIATNSSERLVRLINDILDIERIESGSVKMEKQVCDVADLINQAVNVMQPLAEKARVTLSVTSLSMKIWADSDRIVQALTNLLSNAVKFSKPDSTVWLDAKEQDEEVLFTVRDTGRGIPSDKLESIFERFQQVDASDSRRQDGTGLGLAICKSIVQQHDGNIWVESILGEGSTFYFIIPVGNFHPQLEHSPTVLICDDDVELRNQLKTLLEEKGYGVLTVESGEAAIACASSHHPDVILLDLVLPGTNGWEVMATLKQRKDTENIPIIICSISTPNYRKLPNQDFAEWLCKPIESNSLLRSLSEILVNTCQHIRVLVVENDEDLASVFVTLLKKYGMETSRAKTGKEAIYKSQEINPDLMILNIVLPEYDGFNVVEWLQQHHQLYKIPLLVYSNCDLNDAERTKLKLGHTEFLTKEQVSTQEFEQKVMELIGHITQNLHQRTSHENQANFSS